MIDRHHPQALIVLAESVGHKDPDEIVGSNFWFLQALQDQHLTLEEIAAAAVRSYHVAYNFPCSLRLDRPRL